MTSKPSAAEILAKHVGIKEATGRNDGPPSKLFAGGREEPWCAHACAYGHREAGNPLPGDVVPTRMRRNPIALVDTMERELKYAKAWRRGKPSIADLRPGALIFRSKRLGSDPATAKTQRHVDMFHSVKDGKAMALRPNWGNGMPLEPIDLSDDSITGWANWPPEAGSVSAAETEPAHGLGAQLSPGLTGARAGERLIASHPGDPPTPRETVASPGRSKR